jgi:hypothetical protein
MKHHETRPDLDHSYAVHAAGEREELTRDPLLLSARIRVAQLGL